MIAKELFEKLKEQDSYIYDEVFTYNSYRAYESDLKEKQVIDIGANVGMFTIFARNYGANKITAIEPNPATFKFLSSNMAGLENIEIINKAVSSSSGEKIAIIKDSGFKDTDGRCYTAKSATGDIESISINDLLKDANDVVLKIDCEGAEYEIIYSISPDNFNKISTIFMEAHDFVAGAKLADNLAKYIMGRGFNLEYSECAYGAPTQVFKFKKELDLELSNKLKELYAHIKGNTNISIDRKTLPDVTCVISTKDRYFSTLPHTLLAICHQTHKPKYLLLYDDSKNKKDLRGDFIYQHIFSLLSFYGIAWEVVWTNEEGQVANHIRSLSKSSTELIYRVDDDEIPEPTVIERLLKNMGPEVGAVGGLVVSSTDIKPMPILASNKIEDIYLALNEQWYIHPCSAPIKEVDHLYSSFIYRKSIAEYSPDLSVVGHREETILTHAIKKKGYKILIDPSARTWHWRNPEGGIRTNDNVNLFSNDERVFQKKMIEWGVKVNDYSYVVLDNGIGDHYAFKSILPLYLKKYGDTKKIFFTTYPQLLSDVSDIRQASIHDAKIMFENIDKYNIYKWMIDHDWKKGLPQAFAKMYNLDYVPGIKKERTTSNDLIIISPYSYLPSHAKSYPFWNVLIPKIKTLGYKIIQIGKNGEVPLTGVDDCWWDLPFSVLEDRIKECKSWIAVDNFLQHLVNNLDVLVKGIVIWGPSNPDIYGYSYNTNILKDTKYLRPDQFGMWKDIKQDEKTKINVESYMPQNKDAFDRPEEIFKIIGRVIGSVQSI